MATRVRHKGQVTIPQEIREAAHIEEGTLVEFSVTDKGVLMKPKVQVLVDPEDAWFFSSEWQSEHREAVAELDRGEGELVESADDLLDALDQA